jgi:hypothetical protein
VGRRLVTQHWRAFVGGYSMGVYLTVDLLGFLLLHNRLEIAEDAAKVPLPAATRLRLPRNEDGEEQDGEPEPPAPAAVHAQAVAWGALLCRPEVTRFLDRHIKPGADTLLRLAPPVLASSADVLLAAIAPEGAVPYMYKLPPLLRGWFSSKLRPEREESILQVLRWFPHLASPLAAEWAFCRGYPTAGRAIADKVLERREESPGQTEEPFGEAALVSRLCNMFRAEPFGVRLW